MARRGAALADIKSNEELDELLEKKCVHGLCGIVFEISFCINNFKFTVLNVYDGFFGPCNAIATNLREFKMVHGGDSLQVTTVCCKNIILGRF